MIATASPMLVPARLDESRLPGATLFHEEWWLNAATNGQWDRVTVERDGVLVASMPFVLRTRFALRLLAMPPYSRTLGPLFAGIPTKPAQKLATQVDLLRKLIAKAPKHDRFEMTLPPDSDLTLAFVTCSYTVTNTFTFIWDGTRPADRVWQEMQPKTRRKIQACAKRLHLERHTSIDRYIRMSSLEHGHRLTNHDDFGAIENIFQACVQRKRAIVLSAVDEDGNDIAVSVLVWGCGVLYNLLAARHPEEAGPGANSFLLWEAMQLARQKGLIYDSDGVYSPHAAVFYSRFGLTPKIRPTVNHGNSWWKIVFMAKAALRPHSVDLYYRL